MHMLVTRVETPQSYVIVRFRESWSIQPTGRFLCRFGRPVTSGRVLGIKYQVSIIIIDMATRHHWMFLLRARLECPMSAIVGKYLRGGIDGCFQY